MGGAAPGGVAGGVILKEEAEDDIELADGADGFAEAGFHPGGAAYLSVAGAHGVLAGGGELGEKCLELKIEIGRHSALDEGGFDRGDGLEENGGAGKEGAVAIRAGDLQLVLCARILCRGEEPGDAGDLAHEAPHGVGYVAALAGAAEE